MKNIRPVNSGRIVFLILRPGKLLLGNTKAWFGSNKIELTKDNDTVYTHPSTKQCNYTYTHPSSKQCTWTPDGSSFYVTGVYDGNGNTSQTISLGFSPTAVLVVLRGYEFDASKCASAFAIRGHNAVLANGGGSWNILSLTSNGFTVYSNDKSMLNDPNYGWGYYFYIAFK